MQLELALALLGMLTFVVLGLSTIVVATAIARKYGPDTRMRMPRRRGALEHWVSEQTGSGFTSAKNYVRLGWVWLLISPIFFPVMYGFDTFNPVSISRRAKSACHRIVTQRDLRSIKGWSAEIESIVDNGEHCRARWVEGETTVLNLDLGPGGSFSAGSLGEREERNGRSSPPRPVKTLVEETLWLSGPHHETVFTELEGVPLRIEVDAGALNSAELRELVGRVRDRAKLAGGYR